MSTVLHCDMNNFYASVECSKRPELNKFPVAVGGDEKMRHGIVLAKNYNAKKFNIITGESLCSARKKCPELVILPPDFKLYREYSKAANKIYYGYTDQVEDFGPDESWLDVTGSTWRFGNGTAIANEIREKIRNELGVTVSVGVSFNKVFAKLGSDMKKPDATTVITENNFKNVVWPLPASDMLFVGKSGNARLSEFGIRTIGDIARTDVRILKRILGKNGELLWEYANGLDRSPVAYADEAEIPKSIGNTTTAYRDLTCDEDIRIFLLAMCESVAYRMRKKHLRCTTVTLHTKTANFVACERQVLVSYPICDSKSLFETAFMIYKKNFPNGGVFRSVGVRASNLVSENNIQLAMDTDIEKTERREKLERSLDAIKEKYGSGVIKTATVMMDKVIG